jgi:hypothetical protein
MLRGERLDPGQFVGRAREMNRSAFREIGLEPGEARRAGQRELPRQIPLAGERPNVDRFFHRGGYKRCAKQA